tara:strand:- start:598 stop:885 length:288 start_codon:yes stop_codon:yes gene_type:complete
MNNVQQEVTAMTARKKFGELLDETYYRDNEFVIKRADKPMAVLIPVNTYNQFISQRERDFKVLDSVWGKDLGVSQKEVEDDVAIAIKEVRKAKNL